MDLSGFRAVVAVMARRPGAADAKTRLASRLDAGERAALYEAFLSDKLAQLAGLSGVHLVVAVAPPDDPAAMDPWRPAAATVVVQRGADLGARLEAVASDLFAAGARAVLLVDSDTPTLPTAFLEEAVNALASEEVDVVLGPAWDGGYYLLGTRAPRSSLFQGIPWSTPAVFRATLEAADAAALRTHVLQSWYDVDHPEDLDRLLGQLSALSPYVRDYPRATARVLAPLARAAREPPRDEVWKTRSVRPVYGNRWLDVTERVVTLPTGYVTLYGVVKTASCVGVLPMVDGTHVILVRQFRYVARRRTWEMPTGGVHAGERIEDAARRELLEEAGVEAITLTPLLAFDTSKSVVDETAHLFVAAVSAAPPKENASPDETEDLEPRIFPVAEAWRLVEHGEIVDAMTIIALLAVANGHRKLLHP
jgi:rSAM/selenodomain-associated transferase 1